MDSLCDTVRLAYGYWRETGNTKPLEATRNAAAWRIVETFREQRINGPGPHSFQPSTPIPSDTVPLSGFGNPARPVGMIYSMFRHSDDAYIYSLFVPAMIISPCDLSKTAGDDGLTGGCDTKLASACGNLAKQVRQATTQHGTVRHPVFGTIWAELLSLPYLEGCGVSNPLYQRIRRFVLSRKNPYFFAGKAGESVGGPYIGLGQIWPPSIIMRALTSTDDREIVQCLGWLRDTMAGTGFMHESLGQGQSAAVHAALVRLDEHAVWGVNAASRR